MQFKVPQFLDIEDKIFGPFTFREFVYLVGGLGITFVLYRWLGFWYSSIPALIILGFSGLLVFYRPNGKPFINMLEAGFQFSTQDKLYIWKRRVIKPGHSSKEKEVVTTPQNYEAKLTGNKLRDLAWSLDVLDLKKEKQ